MMNKFLYTIIAASVTLGAYAQKSDGSTKSLLKAEKEFAESLAKNGAKMAFTTFAAADGLVFRPNPVNAKTFYATQPESKDLSWTPVYAKVSRSGDWGFSTGSYIEKGDKTSYGQYLSVWKAKDGKWELDLDMGTSNNKPLNKVTPLFVEPKDFYKPKFLNDKQRAAGADIIATTEKTLNATLKSYGMAAFAGFLNPDARLLFPGYEPMIGKDNIVPFFNSMVSKVSFKTTKVSKADGGDLAYTYGVATVDYKADLRESFNYVFIYERQADHNWNIIVQAFAPAER
ncbi:nuclear transport factor 2 family protein [Pedobacter nyackensis]|uniref:nuclear transport factor 2 family protein n=1 Tax=Pedobacter nyackensis TaxID=475255 RepID=UPI00292D611C|nr:nuclear transport factor 2 family protein [Pedobacter nyackensis]